VDQSPATSGVQKLREGKEVRFVGYGDRYNTYRFYSEIERRIYISCDVKFLEGPIEKKGKLEIDEAVVNLTSDLDQEEEQKDTAPDSASSNSYKTAEDDGDKTLDSQEQSGPEEQGCGARQQGNINDMIHNEILERSTRHASARKSPPLTRSKLNSLPQDKIDAFNRDVNMKIKTDFISKSVMKPIYEDHEQIELALMAVNKEPGSIQEAKNDTNWEKWRAAMLEEIDSLKQNKTWDLIDKPKNRRVKLIKTRWVYRIKPATKTEPERFKARLVAKGYLQRPNIDYGNTYAPVASLNSIRILTWLATFLGMNLLQFDVKTAFLHGEL